MSRTMYGNEAVTRVHDAQSGKPLDAQLAAIDEANFRDGFAVIDARPAPLTHADAGPYLDFVLAAANYYSAREEYEALDRRLAEARKRLLALPAAPELSGAPEARHYAFQNLADTVAKLEETWAHSLIARAERAQAAGDAALARKHSEAATEAASLSTQWNTRYETLRDGIRAY